MATKKNEKAMAYAIADDNKNFSKKKLLKKARTI